MSVSRSPQNQTPPWARPRRRTGRLLSLALLSTLLLVSSEWSCAATQSSDLTLSKRAQKALELFGLEDLAEAPLPAPVAKDGETSRVLKAHILYLEACYQMARNKLVEPRQKFEEAAKLVPDNYEIQLMLADLDSRTLKDDRALKACDRLIDERPGRIEAYELKGKILQNSQREADAIAVYLEAQKRWPGSDNLFKVLPRLTLAKGELDLTIEVCKRRLEREPRFFDALWWVGFVYTLKAQNAGDPKQAGERTECYRQAAKYYEAALESRPSQTKLYPRLAEVYGRLGDRKKAIATMRRAMVADPTDPELRKRFEQEVSPQGKPEELLAAYRSLAEDYPSSPDILDLYITNLIGRQDFAEARRQLARLLELEPNSVKTLMALGGLELQADDVARAREHFDRAIQLAGEDAKTDEEIGNLYLRAQQPDEAVRFFERAIARDPQRVGLYFALGQAYQQLRQLDKATAAIERGLKAIEQSKSRKPLLLALGTLQQQKKQYPEAVKTLRQAYELDRTDLLVFFRLCNLLLTMEDKTALDELVAQGRKTFANSTDDFQEMLGALLMEFHRYSDAIPEYEALKKRHAGRWSYYRQLSICYQRLRQSANGERLFDEARERLGATAPSFHRFEAIHYSVRYENKKAADALLKLLDETTFSLTREAVADRFTLYESAMFNLGRGNQTDKLGELLKRAEREQLGKADPEQLKSLRARALTEMKRFDEAVALYREMIEDDPKDARLQYELGAVLNEAKRNDEAEKALRKCLELLPEAPTNSEDAELRATALNHLGYMFAEQGVRLAEARKYLDQALELQPRAGFIIDSAGWLEYQEGRNDKALELLKKSYDYSSEDPTVCDHLGDAYSKAGDRKKALEFWREALRLDSSLDEVKAKIAKAKK